jgi:hypothetical protein
MRTSRNLLLAFTLLFSSHAFACSIFIAPPDDQFEQSQAVVFAVPKAISFLPREASKRTYKGSFRQTILWEVLISWKGKYTRGMTFTTRRSFDGERLCGSGSPHYFRETSLLYLRGQEPYSKFHSANPAYAGEDFKYLESLRRP